MKVFFFIFITKEAHIQAITTIQIFQSDYLGMQPIFYVHFFDGKFCSYNFFSKRELKGSTKIKELSFIRNFNVLENCLLITFKSAVSTKKHYQ